jgi:hypothetical protein
LEDGNKLSTTRALDPLPDVNGIGVVNGPALAANEVDHVGGAVPTAAQGNSGEIVSEGRLKNHLTPMFGRCSLHEITYGLLQSYFSGMKTSELSHESRDKIRDVLSSVLGAAAVIP